LARDRFVGELEGFPEDVDRVAESFGAVRGALLWWAGRVEGGQGVADGALLRARVAKGDVEVADGRVSARVEAAKAAHVAYGQAKATFDAYSGVVAPDGVVVPSPAQLAGLAQVASVADGAVDSARSVRADAVGRLDAAKALVVGAAQEYRADARVARGKIDAARDGVDGYSWWENVYRSDVWGVLVTVACVVAAVVAVAAMFVAGPVLLAIAAIATAIVLVNGLMAWQAGDATMTEFLLDLVLTVIPMGKVVKALKIAGKGLLGLTPAGSKLVSVGKKIVGGAKAVANAGKRIVRRGLDGGKMFIAKKTGGLKKVKPGNPTRSRFNQSGNQKKGKFGEAQAAAYMEAHGWKRIDLGKQYHGIDSIFEKETGFLFWKKTRYTIVEAKFDKSKLQKIKSGAKQMDDEWLTHGGDSSRIHKALGPEKKKEIAAIKSGIKKGTVGRVLMQVAPDGTVTAKNLDRAANILDTAVML
jgi:hypothetical protein